MVITNFIQDSKPDPLNIYAKSKLFGEQEVLKHNQEAIIIRTNFLEMDLLIDLLFRIK